jgi:LysM repeat protein
MHPTPNNSHPLSTIPHYALRTPHSALVFLLVLLLVLLLAACDTGPGATDPIKLEITPAATPTTTPLAQPTIPPTTYTVRSGDTLSGIATTFGLTVDDIVRTNNIADPNSLTVGQVLTIPARSPETPAAASTHTPEPPPTTPTLLPPDVTPPLGPTTPPD